MNDDYIDVTELGTHAGANELHLWRAALVVLIQDGRDHWLQKKAPDSEAKEAFDDLCRCGPMVRWICRHTGDEPRTVCEAFRGWCRDN